MVCALVSYINVVKGLAATFLSAILILCTKLTRSLLVLSHLSVTVIPVYKAEQESASYVELYPMCQ